MDPSSITQINQEVLSIFPILASIFKEEHDDLSSTPILSLASPSNVSVIKKLALPQVPQPIESVIAEAKSIYTHRIRNQHPRFFGFIPSPTSPISLLGHVLASLYNAHA
jgi:hypothetical protein